MRLHSGRDDGKGEKRANTKNPKEDTLRPLQKRKKMIMIGTEEKKKKFNRSVVVDGCKMYVVYS